jgi:hypothetical protein
MGGKVFKLLQRFLDLWRGWRWWWIGIGFDLVGIGVAWCRVCDLWHYGVVGYLWNWRTLRMVGSGIVVRLVICWRLGLAILVCLVWIMRRVGCGMLLVVWSPLHYVVNFPRR